MFTLTILGAVPTKKNSYRISKNGGFFKPKKITDFERMFGQECVAQRIGLIRGKARVTLEMYFGKHEPDIDGSLTTVMDCLQNAGIIDNDRDVVEVLARKFPIAGTARSVITISQVL